jgi:uncharacterized protein (TIGR03435 family)
MKMRIVVFLAVAGLWAQTAPAPAWKEFSIGPMVKPGGRYGNDGIRGDGVPLKKVIAKAYGLPEHRIVGPDWVNAQRYQWTAVVADPVNFQPFMKQELASRFHMEAHRETRDVPVYILRASPDARPDGPPASTKGVGGTEMAPVGLRMPRSNMADFAGTLADMLLRPVFDETGMEGVYDIALGWKFGNTESLKKAVKDQLGIEIVDDRREVELLIIDHIEKPEFTK